MARDPDRIPRLLMKAEIVCHENGWSVGELVARLAGNGATQSQDPFYMEDDVLESRLDSRLPETSMAEDGETRETFDALEEHWSQYTDLRFCQMVCNAHSQRFDEGESVHEDAPYPETIDSLTDRELRNAL